MARRPLKNSTQQTGMPITSLLTSTPVVRGMTIEQKTIMATVKVLKKMNSKKLHFLHIFHTEKAIQIFCSQHDNYHKLHEYIYIYTFIHTYRQHSWRISSDSGSLLPATFNLQHRHLNHGASKYSTHNYTDITIM